MKSRIAIIFTGTVVQIIRSKGGNKVWYVYVIKQFAFSLHIAIHHSKIQLSRRRRCVWQKHQLCLLVLSLR